jgi:hypothetical protein
MILDKEIYPKRRLYKTVANVSYDIRHPGTRDRELNGLVEALHYFGCNEGFLLTREHEETVTRDGKTVTILPLWKWLLTSRSSLVLFQSPFLQSEVPRLINLGQFPFP